MYIYKAVMRTLTAVIGVLTGNDQMLSCMGNFR